MQCLILSCGTSLLWESVYDNKVSSKGKENTHGMSTPRKVSLFLIGGYSLTFLDYSTQVPYFA